MDHHFVDKWKVKKGTIKGKAREKQSHFGLLFFVGQPKLRERERKGSPWSSSLACRGMLQAQVRSFFLFDLVHIIACNDQVVLVNFGEVIRRRRTRREREKEGTGMKRKKGERRAPQLAHGKQVVKEKGFVFKQSKCFSKQFHL